jgi:hypothetical protein
MKPESMNSTQLTLQPVTRGVRPAICVSWLLGLAAALATVSCTEAATLGEALNATNLTWITGGDAPWFVQTTNTLDGVAAAQSGNIGDRQESWLQTVVGPGPLSFWWKVSSEDECDYLEFYVNGEILSRIAYERDWQQQTFTLTASTNILLWRYMKDESESRGSDAGWVDQVSAAAIEGPPMIVAQPVSRTNNYGTTVNFTVLVAGTPPLTYQWRKDGTDLSGAGTISGSDTTTLTLRSVRLSDAGGYSVVITNLSGGVTSAVASLTIVDPVVLTQPINQVVNLGQSAAFSLMATGSPPLSYQWRKDGAPLAGSTNAWLAFTSVQPADLADYDVIATNLFGSVTSAVARLALPVPLALAGQWPGWQRGSAQAVAASGNYAYVADGGTGLQVIDVSNPTHPVRVGGYVASVGAYDVAVSGPYAFVVGSTWTGSNYVGALEVIDVTNPANPVRMGNGCEVDGWASGLAVLGNYAYVAGSVWTGSNYLEGLQVVDVSNPADPVRVGACATTGSAYKVVVSGNHAYVAGYGAGLQIVDVTDPFNPVRVGDWEHWDTYDVAVSGNYAFVIYQTDYTSGLFAIDVANPANPVRMGNGYELDGWANSLKVIGNYAYVAGDGECLQVVDVSNPARPVRVGHSDVTGHACDVAVSGNYAYVAGREVGLHMISLGSLVNPVRVGGYFSGAAARVALSGNYAYVADGNAGLQVIEVSHPEQPTGLGNYATGGCALDVAASGTHAYLVNTRVTGGRYVETLQAIDVSDPAKPVGVGTYEIVDSYRGNVAVAGNYAYLTGTWWTDTGNVAAFQVIDVSDPAHPVRTGSYQTNGVPEGNLAISGQYAYAVLGGSLQVINVSNPANPVRVGGYLPAGSIGGVAVAGHYAFLTEPNLRWNGSNWAGALQILDVSNPSNPVPVGVFETTEVGSVSASGGYACVAVGGGLQVIDVSNPANPVCVGSYATRGAPAGVALAGHCAYVAQGAWGLAILQFRPTIHTAGGLFGLTAGQFGFCFSGLAGQSVVIEASTNLVNWMPFQTNILDHSPLYFSDPDSTKRPMRFYRAHPKP